MNQDLNELASICHTANDKWWRNPADNTPIQRNKGELLMLMVSELAEAMEGERKNLMDDKLAHRRMAEVEMADVLIRALDYTGGFKLILPSVEAWEVLPQHKLANKGAKLLELVKLVNKISDAEEVPDTFGAAIGLARLIEGVEGYCRDYQYDLQGAFDEKMSFNSVREDHTHEARLKTGGKIF